MWQIKGKYPGQPMEIIDEFETREEAVKMMTEYRLAFGAGWSLYLKQK